MLAITASESSSSSSSAEVVAVASVAAKSEPTAAHISSDENRKRALTSAQIALAAQVLATDAGTAISFLAPHSIVSSLVTEFCTLLLFFVSEAVVLNAFNISIELQGQHVQCLRSGRWLNGIYLATEAPFFRAPLNGKCLSR